MKPLLVLLLLTACQFASADDGWIDLFDGKSTDGWTPRAEVETFEAKDGELHLLTKTNCWVTTDQKMDDFEAELEVKLPAEPAFNSGLAFRCQGAKGKPKGYQIEIDRAKPGGIYGIGLGGWIYPTKAEDAAYKKKIKGLLKPDEWNHFKVRAEGSRIQTWLNGKPIADTKSDAQLKGYFGIQHHGKGGTVKFRNIRARPLKSTKQAAKQTRPNILWITAEDMSPTLGCYGDKYATTPNIDHLAKQSTRYDNAFAASPVCSPSRSTLITGMYNVSTGTHQMRSGFPLPTGVKGFPSYLRDTGYFTTNNVKTDYNTSDSERLIAESWNESSADAHWRNPARKKDQPFFSVFNLMTSHQSRTMVWPYAAFEKHVQSKLSPGEIHDPKNAPVPPYYADTPLVRKSIARYYDCVTAMDKEVGGILAQLKEDGLADDTIVFFYSDHGSGMPRHKRLLHDSGMKVAMLVHFPEKWQHLRPTEPGKATDRLVSFVDFAPTVLQLTEQNIPAYMQGSPFLASDAPERKIVYGTRDRVDEVFDCARSVRDKRWLYIRNHRPDLGWGQPSVFSDLGEIRASILGNAKTPAQKHFTSQARQAEELYDCQADPNNVTNLVNSGTPKVKEALKKMRTEYKRVRGEIRDLGAIPESEMRLWIDQESAPMRDIVLGKTDQFPDLKAAWKGADYVGIRRSDNQEYAEECFEILESHPPEQRYWAMATMRTTAIVIRGRLEEYLDDTSPAVRIDLAWWLARGGGSEAALARLAKDLEHEDWAVALQACRAIELLGEDAISLKPTMRALYDRTRHAPGDNNFFIAFSSGAYLDKLGEKTDPWDFSPGAGSFMPAKKKK